LGFPSNAVEIIMSTADGKTYTGTADFGMGDCDEEWIYVLTGESCCPVVCSKTVTVDNITPFAQLIAEVEDCTDDCDSGTRVTITSDGFLPGSDCDELCCGDDCTALGDWTLSVYDTQPFREDDCGDCEAVNACIEPIEVCSGSGCDIECVFDCVPEDDWADATGNYYVILEKADLVGNAETTYGFLVLGGDKDHPNVTLNDATRSAACDIVESGDDNIMGDCEAALHYY